MLLFREACTALAFWEAVEPIIARCKQAKLLKTEVAGMCDESVTPAPPLILHSQFRNQTVSKMSGFEIGAPEQAQSH